MIETISVRDHSQPCEHGLLWPHWIDGKKARWWRAPECPGGREMVLRHVEKDLWTSLRPDEIRTSSV